MISILSYYLYKKAKLFQKNFSQHPIELENSIKREVFVFMCPQPMWGIIAFLSHTE